MTKTPTSRLDKLLANMGYASRREIQLLAKNGRILLDGAPVPRADERIALTPDLEARLVVDREPLGSRPARLRPSAGALAAARPRDLDGRPTR